jgi:hypothetical protein
MEDHSRLKQIIHEHCAEALTERIGAAAAAIAQLEALLAGLAGPGAHAKNEALARIELEKQRALLEHLLSMQTLFAGIDPSGHHDRIGSGALVRTDLGMFYIAVALGKIVAQGLHVWVISPQAPIYQVLKDTPVGEIAFFNGQAYRMQRVA